MKTWMGVLVVIAAIIGPPVATTVLMASGGTSNDVTITSVQIQYTPPGAEKVVVASGAYDVASGYTLAGITVNIMPTGGAAGEGADFVANTSQSGFGGGVSTPGGTYDVQAILTVIDSIGTAYYFFSNTVTGVTVPSP